MTRGTVRFTDLEAARIRKLYNNKTASMVTIARQHKCGVATIYDVIHKLGPYGLGPDSAF